LSFAVSETLKAGKWFDRIIIFVFENHSYDGMKEKCDRFTQTNRSRKRP
jgi:hypothetical protein